MTVTDLQRRYDYGYWATRKLLAVITQLTPEQFTQSVAGSYGSIRNTMVHTLSAEWGWLDRSGGHRRGPALKGEDFPTLRSVTDKWTEIEGHTRTFLSNLKDSDLARVVEFELLGQKFRMTVSEMLEHAVNHGVHHRGQLALLLRVLGHAPGNFDLLFYDAEARGRRVIKAILAFVALPGTIAFLIPLTLVDPRIRFEGFSAAGWTLLIAGSALLLWCVRECYVEGKGTLAPWSPPKHLVVSGLYRWSRNPMYVAVVVVLLSWAVGFRSTPLAWYAAVVTMGFHLRVVLGEEPWLARTHGEQWNRYRARVRRWL